MSDDDKPPMPPQPATIRLEAIPLWASELSKNVRDGIAELRADVGLVSNDLGIVKDRVAILEADRNDNNARAAKLSGGVRGLSQSDLGQNMQIASLAVKVDELSATNAAQLAILARLDRVASNPTVKVILFALGTIATGYLASKGLR